MDPVDRFFENSLCSPKRVTCTQISAYFFKFAFCQPFHLYINKLEIRYHNYVTLTLFFDFLHFWLFHYYFWDFKNSNVKIIILWCRFVWRKRKKAKKTWKTYEWKRMETGIIYFLRESRCPRCGPTPMVFCWNTCLSRV